MAVRIATGSELRKERIFINPYDGSVTDDKLKRPRPQSVEAGDDTENTEGEGGETEKKENE